LFQRCVEERYAKKKWVQAEPEEKLEPSLNEEALDQFDYH
jgi:hypothetical protein